MTRTIYRFADAKWKMTRAISLFARVNQQIARVILLFMRIKLRRTGLPGAIDR
jgi:hypothetical protein